MKIAVLIFVIVLIAATLLAQLPMGGVTVTSSSPAVAYDNSSAVASGSGVTTLATTSFTVGSGSNRVAVVGLALSINTATGISVTVGGQTATLVTGADTGTNLTFRLYMFCAANPASGSQTASASWTGSAGSAYIAAMTASNVDQSTPCTNGGQNSTTSVPTNNLSLSVTSTSGDLTTTIGLSPGADGLSTNQTLHWTIATFIGEDTGPGTGTTNHTWTTGTHVGFGIVGANLKKAP